MPDVPAPNYGAMTSVPGAANPLQTMGQVVGLQTNMLNMQALNQQLTARAAMGPLAQASVNPETGQMDYGKFAVLISSDPRTAWMAPDIINTIATRELTQAQIMKTGLENAISQQKLITGVAAGLLDRYGNNVTKANVQEAIAAEPGTMDVFGGPAKTLQFLQNLPQDGLPLAQALRQAVTRGWASQGNLEGTYGKTFAGEGGGGVTPLLKTQQGQTSQVGAITQMPTSAERSAITPTLTPSGATQANVRGAIPGLPMLPGGGGTLGPGGQNFTPLQPQVGGVAPQGPGGGMPPGPGVGLGGSVGAEAPGTGGGMGQVPQQAPSPPLTKLAPFDQSLQQGLAEQQKKYGDDLNSVAPKAAQGIQIIDELQRIAPTIETGGVAKAKAELGNFAKAMGFPQSTIDAIANNNLANSQEAIKLFTLLSTDLMTTALHGGGRYTEHQYTDYQHNNANINTVSGALNNMLAFQKDMLQNKIDEQNHYAEWLTRYQTAPDAATRAQYNPSKFQGIWNQYLVDQAKARTAAGGVP